MKKTISIFLIFAMLFTVFSAVPISVFAETPERYVTIDHVDYVLQQEDGEQYYMVETYFDSIEYAKTATEIKITDQINGIPVLEIKTNWAYLQDESSGPRVKVSDSTDYHERYYKKHDKAFGQNVKKITLPDSIRQIGYSAFSNMTSLKSITIPKKVNSIWNGTFKNCTSLSKVTFKGKVKSIGAMAFYNCKALKSIKLPDSLEKIGDGAFDNSGLVSITIPAKTEDIGEESGIFTNCKSLKTVKFETPKRKKYIVILPATFMGCEKLEKVYFPKNGKALWIEEDAFSGCKKLKKLVNYSYADQMDIETNSFKNCISLKQFTITTNITCIRENAFAGCKNLAKFYVKTSTFSHKYTKSTSPKIRKNALKGTKSGVKFITYGKVSAKRLKKALKDTGVKKAKIYVNSPKLVYKDIK